MQQGWGAGPGAGLRPSFNADLVGLGHPLQSWGAWQVGLEPETATRSQPACHVNRKRESVPENHPPCEERLRACLRAVEAPDPAGPAFSTGK